MSKGQPSTNVVLSSRDKVQPDMSRGTCKSRAVSSERQLNAGIGAVPGWGPDLVVEETICLS